MTTHQRGKNNDSDDSSGDVGSNSDDEQPSRLVQIKLSRLSVIISLAWLFARSTMLVVGDT